MLVEQGNKNLKVEGPVWGSSCHGARTKLTAARFSAAFSGCPRAHSPGHRCSTRRSQRPRGRAEGVASAGVGRALLLAIAGLALRTRYWRPRIRGKNTEAQAGSRGRVGCAKSIDFAKPKSMARRRCHPASWVVCPVDAEWMAAGEIYIPFSTTPRPAHERRHAQPRRTSPARWQPCAVPVGAGNAIGGSRPRRTRATPRHGWYHLIADPTGAFLWQNRSGIHRIG